MFGNPLGEAGRLGESTTGRIVAVGLSVFLLFALVPAGDAAAAASYPIDARHTQAGPFTTAPGTVSDGSGKVIYDIFRPADHAALGFTSPIVIWGNGTDAAPNMYSTLLTHFASWGFTVIASTLANTG